MNKRILPFLAIGILMILMLPLIKNEGHKVEESLFYRKSFDRRKLPELNIKHWWNGVFQSNYEQYLNEEIGFRVWWIKIRNQFSYSLFRQPEAKNVVIGKDGYLFEKSYIQSYSGQDFVGMDTLFSHVSKIKRLQEELESQNKAFLWAIAPGKGHFYPEYIPDKRIQERTTTNLEAALQLSDSLNVQVLDFNAWFLNQKSKSTCKMYPKLGTHWSHYAMLQSMDSLMHYFVKNHGYCMPEFIWGTTVQTNQTRFFDRDIANGMNLLISLSSDTLCYAEITYSVSNCPEIPSILVLSDSYYRDFYNLGKENGFHFADYLYYNRELYTAKDTLDLEEKPMVYDTLLEAYDIILFLETEANIKRLSYGFLNNVLQN